MMTDMEKLLANLANERARDKPDIPEWVNENGRMECEEGI